jgi:Multicopper oxidase
MAIEYWIQLENHPWDVCPREKDRMIGKIDAGAITAQMVFDSPNGTHYQIQGFFPLVRDPGPPVAVADALILRRYKAPAPGKQQDWKTPDDRKVNPWDVNERDPRERDQHGNTVMGTMGTIPGPTIECNVGETVIVHFRNLDGRKFGPDGQGISPLSLVHSLHTHGFVFAQESDGAYPLSSLSGQPITSAEEGAWKTVPAPGGGDPLAQFRNKSGKLFKRGDRVPVGGTFDYTWDTVGWPTTAGVWIYHDHSIDDTNNTKLGAIGFVVIHNTADENDVIVTPTDLPNGDFNGSPIPCPDNPPSGQTVIQPPARAQYLLLFHTLLDPQRGALTCINGRRFLGNTPTLIAGASTKMRFGVAGMGDARDGFHTFHLHGHRWVIPGPDGNKDAGGGNTPGANSIQNSAMIKAVSQFEDTKVFGPANSFVFTIREDAASFMRAKPALGEWHMHCHVLDHMTQGMMGSLLVVEKDQVLDLPVGVSNVAMERMRLKLQQAMKSML